LRHRRKHKIAGGEYNRRREECEEAVRSLERVLPGIRALRDVNLEQLEEYLVETSSAEAFAESVANVYEKETGIVPTSYIGMPAVGGGLVE
jgi:galactokinase